MTTMIIERDGRLALPLDIQERCGTLPETLVRVIETRNGILLVPLTDAPMSAKPTEELQGLADTRSADVGAVPSRG